jgi:primosomal protein N' (replication factor Y)
MKDDLELFPAVGPPPPSSVKVARVALDVPLRRVFDYLVPDPIDALVQVGARVVVNFHNRQATGFVTERATTSEVPHEKLKPLVELVDASEPPLTQEVMTLGFWVSGYYACGPGEAFAAAVPQDTAPRREKTRRDALDLDLVARLRPDHGVALRGVKQKALVAALEKAGGALAVGALLEAAAADRSSFEKLVAHGVVGLEEESGAPVDAPEPPAPTLTGEQEKALAPLLEDVEARRFHVSLLHGVTGSGKTEVYLRAIARVLELGRTAIVLVPEIALTPQTERRFKARFGERVAVLHSRQTGRVRADEWWRARRGEARVVVGPRSAVWAPVPDLGLVVVDEEHDGSYKQETQPRYHARDTAIVRARAANAPVILGSATPSLESWQNAQEGKFRLLRLTQRPGGAQLPRCDVIDMREEYREQRGQPLFSRTLVLLLEEAFRREERAIVFMNRRGFTTYLHCPRCGHVAKCPQCDIVLAFHKRDAVLLCHFCQHRSPPPRGVCPACDGPPLRQTGAGTERIEETFAKLFPAVSAVRLDTDALTGGVTAEDILRRFRQGDARALIGTQMVAKGLDVASVTVVGVVSADTGLALPDFRASERTFQLVAQVAGRAGRGERPGRTVIQTFNPEHEAIALASRHDFEGFARSELETRKAHGYPPFSRLLKALWRGAALDRVEAEARAACDDLRAAMEKENARVLGPAPSPRAYLSGKHRLQALVKAPTPLAIKRAVAALESRAGDKQVELVLDVDPFHLL